MNLVERETNVMHHSCFSTHKLNAFQQITMLVFTYERVHLRYHVLKNVTIYLLRVIKMKMKLERKTCS